MSAETDLLSRSWIANASAWCDAVRNQRIESRRAVTDKAIVTAILEDHPGKVLDIGCGEGWLARALNAHDVAVTGVDFSPPLVEAAEALGGGVFMTSSYRELIDEPSLVGSGFDTIVANFSLLDDKTEDLLSALLPVLSVDGRLIIQTAHPLFVSADGGYIDGWRTETFQGFPGVWLESMPWYFRTLGSWSQVLTGSGYALVQIREPMYPDRPVPASIIFISRRASAK